MDPVASVIVDVNALGVDHTFDYLVSQRLSETAQPGARVRVRFAGRLVDGFIVARMAQSEHAGNLMRLSRVLGPPVLTQEIAVLARDVADRYAGTMSEVLRDAIPPRHARTEKAVAGEREGAAREPGGQEARSHRADQVWQEYEGAAALLSKLGSGCADGATSRDTRREAYRAALTFSAVDDPATLMADLAQTVKSGSVIVVVPDLGDLERILPAFRDRFGANLGILSAADSAASRYREFLRIRNGDCHVVIGTRSAVFAPVVDLGLIVIYDDADDSFVEPRAPGWHAREVAALRSLRSGAHLVMAGFSRSVEVQRLVARHWLHSIQAIRAHRQLAARVLTAANARATDPSLGARIPQFAWQTIQRGLQTGPVLVQVSRGGYLPVLACQDCREIAQCQTCSGPLGRSQADGELACQWCARVQEQFECSNCSCTRLRAVRVGSHRTRDELAAAFPEVAVLVSGADTGVIRSIGHAPQIVVATVGAEPIVEGGYQAAVLLDGNAMVARADLRSEEQTMRRWFNAVSLVKAAAAGGLVAVTADPNHRAVQALVRADPVGWAQRELADREQTGLPPASRCAVVSGSAAGVNRFLAQLRARPTWRVLGPTPIDHERGTTSQARVMVFAPTADGSALAQVVKRALLETPVETDGIRLRLRIDPISILG